MTKELLAFVILCNIVFVVTLVYTYIRFRNSHFESFERYLDIRGGEWQTLSYLILWVEGLGLIAYHTFKLIYKLL